MGRNDKNVKKTTNINVNENFKQIYIAIFETKLFFSNSNQITEYENHRLIKITDITLDVVFSRFICIWFTMTLRQKSTGVKRSRCRTGSRSVDLQDRERACSSPNMRNSFGILPQSYCERNT